MRGRNTAVRLDVGKLRWEMAIRALTPEDLACAAALHPDTVYNALRSDWVRLATARSIAGVLQRTSPVDGLADLVATEVTNPTP